MKKKIFKIMTFNLLLKTINLFLFIYISNQKIRMYTFSGSGLNRNFVSRNSVAFEHKYGYCNTMLAFIE